MDNAVEIPTDDLANDKANLFTCMSDLFKPTCVEEIQHQITIGDDLMNQEVTQVKELIAEFADRVSGNHNDYMSLDFHSLLKFK